MELEMTIEEALKKGTEILKQGLIEAPAREAGVLLSYVLNKDKYYIYAHGSERMAPAQNRLYEKWISERASGKPLQYITGMQEFMSIRFRVNEDVMIPRQETETLVEAVIEYARNAQHAGHTQYAGHAKHTRQTGYAQHVRHAGYAQHAQTSGSRPLRFLDLGTGSGCIAVSLAFYIENCAVTAVDISESALAVARVNAESAGVAEKINFVVSDLFSALEPAAYDAIVSNPPYIPMHQRQCLQREVREYEPGIALFGGEDGLDFYRRITAKSPEYLNQNGMLFFEVGEGQADDVLKLMEPYFHSLSVYKDLAGIDRVVSGVLK